MVAVYGAGLAAGVQTYFQQFITATSMHIIYHEKQRNRIYPTPC